MIPMPTKSVWLALALALTATGCQEPESLWQPGVAPKRPGAEAVSYAVVLPASDRTTTLTAAQRQGLERFVRGLPDPYRVEVLIRGLPGGPPGKPGPELETIRLLVAGGVMPGNIRFEPGTPGAGPVTVQARYFVARLPPCPDHSHQHIQDGTFRPSSNLGCANAEALARMIADPRDLVDGGSSGFASGEVQAEAGRRYGQGRIQPLPTEGIRAGSASPNTSGGAPATKDK